MPVSGTSRWPARLRKDVDEDTLLLADNIGTLLQFSALLQRAPTEKERRRVEGSIDRAALLVARSLRLVLRETVRREIALQADCLSNDIADILRAVESSR